MLNFEFDTESFCYLNCEFLIGLVKMVQLPYKDFFLLWTCNSFQSIDKIVNSILFFIDF